MFALWFIMAKWIHSHVHSFDCHAHILIGTWIIMSQGPAHFRTLTHRSLSCPVNEVVWQKSFATSELPVDITGPLCNSWCCCHLIHPDQSDEVVDFDSSGLSVYLWLIYLFFLGGGTPLEFMLQLHRLRCPKSLSSSAWVRLVKCHPGKIALGDLSGTASSRWKWTRDTQRGWTLVSPFARVSERAGLLSLSASLSVRACRSEHHQHSRRRFLFLSSFPDFCRLSRQTVTGSEAVFYLFLLFIGEREITRVWRRCSAQRKPVHPRDWLFLQMKKSKRCFLLWATPSASRP